MNTAHGAVSTPVFLPVGTQGAVKSLTTEDLESARVEMILGNTYHLYLRPGHELIRQMGGLHRFMNWPRPILTDSGGFQVFSLSDLRKITDDGVQFQSHLDGSYHEFTPEKAIEVQEALGSDIMMAFDECPPYPSTYQYIHDSVIKTLNWARRCQESRTREDQALFGIVQGGPFLDLRRRSAEETMSMAFDGYAIGGLAVGEERGVRDEVVESVNVLLPEDRPRYLMGVGTPEELVEYAGRGIDMFDCVIPTRNARNGMLFTRKGKVSIKNARFAEDEGPVDEECGCLTCRGYSRAYLRHLFQAQELSAYRLNSLHNMQYYMDLMGDVREAISQDRYESFKRDFFNNREQNDLDT